MASTREIKRRIKLIKTTSQITRAMELVAATKMRKAEADARGAREYAAKALELLIRLKEYTENHSHPLLETHREGKTLVLVVTPDRGLAGALSANVLREAMNSLSKIPREQTDIMTIGKRGQEFFRKSGYNVIATATRLDWKPQIFDIRPFAKIAIEGYLSLEYRYIFLIFSDFISASSQKPKILTLLPFSANKTSDTAVLESKISGVALKHESKRYQYLVEPSPKLVLDAIIRNLIEVEIYQALLESNASEHSARMIAMHSATENAKDLNSDLTLSFNRIRQESITREIAEISAGANA